MAAASATLAPLTFAAAASTIASPKGRKTNKLKYITGLNSCSGLKAQNYLSALGQPMSAQQRFFELVSSLKVPAAGKRRGRGALSTTCSAAGEIFRIAGIMNGLVLIGVAVGFLLLRIEASVEESES